MIPVERHNLRRISDPNRQEMILSAISDIDPSSDIMNEASGLLSSLSSNTVVEEIDASGEGVFEWENNTDRFEAFATIYVLLNYGDKRDSVSMSDSYPAIIRGSIVNGAVSIANVDVDVSSFGD